MININKRKSVFLFWINLLSSLSALSGLPDVGDDSVEDISVFCRAEQFSHASHAGHFLIFLNQLFSPGSTTTLNFSFENQLKQPIFTTSQDVTKARYFPALDTN